MVPPSNLPLMIWNGIKGKSMIARLFVVMMLALLAGPLESAVFSEYDYEILANAGGKKIIHNGMPHFMVEIPKKKFEEINAGRKMLKKEVHPFDDVKSVPWTNREYFKDWANLLVAEIEKKLSGPCTIEQVYGYWKKERDLVKANWQVDKITDEDFTLRVKLIRTMKSEREAVLSKGRTPHPDPLPTDGRRPVPHRYRAERP